MKSVLGGRRCICSAQRIRYIPNRSENSMVSSAAERRAVVVVLKLEVRQEGADDAGRRAGANAQGRQQR